MDLVAYMLAQGATTQEILEGYPTLPSVRISLNSMVGATGLEPVTSCV